MQQRRATRWLSTLHTAHLPLRRIAFLSLMLVCAAGMAPGAERDHAKPDDVAKCNLTLDVHHGSLRATIETANNTDHEVHVDSTPEIRWSGHWIEKGEGVGGGGNASGVEHQVSLRPGEKLRRHCDLGRVGEWHDGSYTFFTRFHSKEVLDVRVDATIEKHTVSQGSATAVR